MFIVVKYANVQLLVPCLAQRAHANFTENHTPLLGALLIAGLRNPFAAAVLGATWSVGRVIYLYGYTSGAGPQGRTVYVHKCPCII